ncbi:hypothetical protein [Persicobacter diffluens]
MRYAAIFYNFIYGMETGLSRVSDFRNAHQWMLTLRFRLAYVLNG